MAKPFKLPKTINGIRLPKATRKQANRFLEKLHGEELEALIAAVVTAGDRPHRHPAAGGRGFVEAEAAGRGRKPPEALKPATR